MSIGANYSKNNWIDNFLSLLPTPIAFGNRLKHSEKGILKLISTSNHLRNNSKTMKILIVEDEPVSQKLLSSYFNRLGCMVDIVETGRQAIEMYKNNYDLVFLDIDLPDLTGIGVCIGIRSQEKEKHTPIIVVTAHSEKKDECIAVGADEFITDYHGTKSTLILGAEWLWQPRFRALGYRYIRVN